MIKDDLFAGSDFFLRAIADHFANCGYNITVSECTMHHIPTYEHIISEETGLAFMTSNFFNRIENETAAAINFGRFYSKEIISSKNSGFHSTKKDLLSLLRKHRKRLTQLWIYMMSLKKIILKQLISKGLIKKLKNLYLKSNHYNFTKMSAYKSAHFSAKILKIFHKNPDYKILPFVNYIRYF